MGNMTIAACVRDRTQLHCRVSAVTSLPTVNHYISCARAMTSDVTVRGEKNMFTIFSLRRSPQEELTETPRWKYSASVYHSKKHHMVFRDDELGVERHIVTRVDPFIFLNGEKELYYIDGVEQTFHSEEEMLREMMRRKNAVAHNADVELAEA